MLGGGGTIRLTIMLGVCYPMLALDLSTSDGILGAAPLNTCRGYVRTEPFHVCGVCRYVRARPSFYFSLENVPHPCVLHVRFITCNTCVC